MTKEFWINLPVKDIKRSKDFYVKLGFTFKPLPDNREDGGYLVLGSKGVMLMLFEEPAFKSFAETEITDTGKSSEVLFSIDAGNNGEVDKFATDVKNAGGIVYAEPVEKDGWMYGCGFMDPDGHRWTIVHLDENKATKHKVELQVP